MECSFLIYRTGEQWFRTKKEAGNYDECIYVEMPGYEVPLDIDLDTLVNCHLHYNWGYHGSMSMKEPYKDGEVITMQAFLSEKNLI